MTDSDNKRHPRTTGDKAAKWEYPWNQVTATAGGHEIHLNSTPDQESSRTFHPAGTYNETYKDGSSVNLTAGKHYHTKSNGTTETNEAAKDSLTMTGSRTNDVQGHHKEIGEDETKGVYGQLISAMKNSGFHYSSDHIGHASPGVFHDHDEDQHHNVTGDKITFIDGTKYEQINKEYGIHVPSGNMDVQVDSGQFRIKSGSIMTLGSNSDMKISSTSDMSANSGGKLNLVGSSDVTLQSDSKITIKVGSSSIVIESGSITIKSAAIKFEQG